MTAMAGYALAHLLTLLLSLGILVYKLLGHWCALGITNTHSHTYPDLLSFELSMSHLFEEANDVLRYMYNL